MQFAIGTKKKLHSAWIFSINQFEPLVVSEGYLIFKLLHYHIASDVIK